MTKTVDFYFDFSSPYGYFSSEVMEDFENRCACKVNWRPYLMGAVMKLTGRKPLVHIPMINEYSARDLARVARYHGIDFTVPSTFPVASIAANRAFYWIEGQRGEKDARQFAKYIFRAYFVENQNISESSVVVDIASRCGCESDEVAAALQDSAIKLVVREKTDQAIERGVFGSPFFLVDGEPFWGHDRLPHVEAWVESGGW